MGLPGDVSILNRPEGRLLQCATCQSFDRHGSFNPQPPRRTAATGRGEWIVGLLPGFNPQPPRRTAATFRLARHRSLLPLCFNPQPPRRTAATGGRSSQPHRAATVSILNRPEGRLLPDGRNEDSMNNSFQSSTAPKDGCYFSACAASFTPSAMFQSSTAPKDGCYHRARVQGAGALHVSILNRPEGRLLRDMDVERGGNRICFNPQPPRRTAATRDAIDYIIHYLFQSSTAPKDGCYPCQSDCEGLRIPLVSILNRPEGRLLRLLNRL